MSHKTKNPGRDEKQFPIRTESGGFNKATRGFSGPKYEGLCLFIWQWILRLGSLVWPMGILRQPRRTVPPFFHFWGSLRIQPSATVETDHNVALVMSCPVSLQKKFSKRSPANAAISSSLGRVTFFKGASMFLLHKICTVVSVPCADLM